MVSLVRDFGDAFEALDQTTRCDKPSLDTHDFHIALSQNTTHPAPADIQSFSGAPTTSHATHAGPSQSGQEALVLRSIAQLRPKTPDPGLMSLYADQDRLPPGEQIADGTWRYGTSLLLHGDESDKEAFDAVRRYAAESGPECQKVLAIIDWGGRRTYVRPYRHAPGVRDAAHSPGTYWKTSNDPFSSELHAHVQFGVDQGLLAPNGAKLSPASAALHELAHAANPENREALTQIPAGLFTDAGEYQAISGAEDAAQVTHGGLRRDSHQDGILYQTDGVTSTAPRDPRVAALFESWRSQQEKLAGQLSRADKFNPPAPAIPVALDPTNAAEVLWVRNIISQSFAQQVIQYEQYPLPNVTPA